MNADKTLPVFSISCYMNNAYIILALSVDHKVLRDIQAFIHKWNELHLPLYPNGSLSSFTDPEGLKAELA